MFGGGKLWALALRQDGRLAGLAPFFVYGTDKERLVAVLGAGVTDYPDILIEPQASTEGSLLLFEHLARGRDRWDLCNFQDVRACSPMLAGPPAALEMRTEHCSTSLVIHLPESWEELLLRVPSGFRIGVRRSRRKLEKSGARLETAGPEDIPEFLDALFRLHTSRWNAREEPGMLANEAVRAFHREAAPEMLRRGLLRLYGLRYQGALAAILYGFAARGRFYAYLSGFDPALERLSPGSVLVAMAIEQSIRVGLREFDFLRKREPFKYLWGAQEQANCRLLIRHSPAFARSAA